MIDLMKEACRYVSMVCLGKVGLMESLTTSGILVSIEMGNRDRPRFFDQVGHQTTNASIGNKHFFTK